MLAAPTTPPNKLRVVSNDTKNKYQHKSFDTFDSPFHTPSLFGTSSNSTTAMKTTIKNHDQTIFSNNINNKYEQYYYKDDYRLFHHNNPIHSSSPESFFSVMADLESSGTRTPSPKNDYCYDTRDEVYKVEPPPPPFLYNHQRKTEPTAIINYNNQQQDQFLGPIDNSASSFGLLMNQEYQQYCYDNTFYQYNNVDRLSNDVARQQLKESIETIHKLVNQLQLMKAEVDKKQVMCANIQSSLTSRDVEYQEQEQKLLMATQYVDTQAMKINALQAELAMYQSFIKSKGLELPVISGEMAVTLESSEIKLNRLCKLREYPETSKSMETISAIRNNDSDLYYNSGRRWSEEKSNFYPSTSENTAERKQNNSSSLSMDYNRMLDKNVNVNWDSLVDRIVKETDQKASLYLQNKFKCASLDQKQLIFESILMQAYNLMTNRFGNFLVQRLLELGTQDQVLSLVDTMKGHILELTCEPFGCHVVQKVLDNVDEPVKASLVSELFVSIPETITHKYACHVWQKIFEIKWEHSPPPIMEHIHEALIGKWAQVALDETGSLVIQNIFENLTEIDKRPVLDEVLKNTVAIAKGQWGNWVIQHILEHAEKSSDRETAFQIVIEEGVQLSIDQFASKVVEKALRIGGEQFMTEFIKKISANHSNHRPRVALIDIASDQYGNYVVQWLINNTCEEQKVYICRLIKRHMVSLRSSKYGQRVAFLVEKVLRNNELTTYPSVGNTSSSSSSMLKNF